MQLFNVQNGNALGQVQVFSGYCVSIQDEFYDNMNDNGSVVLVNTVAQATNIQFLLGFTQLFMTGPTLTSKFMLE